MNKKHFHHVWIRLRPIRSVYFFVIAGLFAVIFLISFRQNNLTMLNLREEVFTADKENGDVEAALRKLREYVYAHMNTDLTPKEDSIRPPIQLKYQYERLVQAEKDRVTVANATVYDDATRTCEQRFPSGQLANGRVQCVQEYVTAHSLSEKPIPDDFYKFDFISPLWAPDAAGWSLVFAVFFLFLGVSRIVIELWFGHIFKKHA